MGGEGERREGGRGERAFGGGIGRPGYGRRMEEIYS